MKNHLETLLPEAIKLAKEAGKAVMEVYESSDFGETYKEDRSPLTKADIASHEIITAGLKNLSSELPVLSEESREIEFSERKSWHTYWLVDPLDGTKEFIKRTHDFTVNIALIENGEPILGVVHVPPKDITYYGSRMKGAYRQKADNEPEKIRVADYNQGKLKIVTSRFHPGGKLKSFLDKIGEHECVHMGSSLKICLVADGTAHLYPRLAPTMEWDTAAAHCVLNEAGGYLTDLKGHPLKYNKEELLNSYFMAGGDPLHSWRSFLP